MLTLLGRKNLRQTPRKRFKKKLLKNPEITFSPNKNYELCDIIYVTILPNCCKKQKSFFAPKSKYLALKFES